MTRSPRPAIWRFAPMSGILEGDITACSHEIANRKQARPGPGQGAREGRHLRPRWARGCRRVGFFPVLANLALSRLDEHVAQMPGGPDSIQDSEPPRPRKGLGNYRVVRYADDW
jgi:hypothetical protein